MDLNIGQIHAAKAMVILFCLLALIVPGFLFLFLFYRDVFFRLDNYRLTLLSVAISGSIFVVNIVLLGIMMTLLNDTKPIETEDQIGRLLLGSSLATFFIVLGSEVFGYLLHIRGTLILGLAVIVSLIMSVWYTLVQIRIINRR